MATKKADRKNSFGYAAYQSETEDEVFIVEKILDKRIVNGDIEYLLKWENYPASSNCWAAAKLLCCKELICAFEAKLKMKKKEVLNRKAKSIQKKAKKNNSNKKAQKVVKKGRKKVKSMPKKVVVDGVMTLEAEMVVGASLNSKGERVLLVKWKNKKFGNFIPAYIANVKWAQKVIDFYEKRLTFLSDGDVSLAKP